MPGNDERRLVLWPESGVPDYLRDGYPARYYLQMTAAGDPAFARRRIGAVIGPESLLLTGAVDLAIGEQGGRSRATRSEEHTSELQSLMRISYAVFCLKKK